MKCPKCGQEMPEGTKFCSRCGYNLEYENSPILDDPAHEIRNTSSSVKGKVAAPSTPVDTSDPKFNGRMNRCIIFGAIGFIFSIFTLLGGLFYQFIDIGESRYTIGVVFLLLGLVGSIVPIFGYVIPTGKKLFGNTQPKGFKYNSPGIFMGFAIAFDVVGLAFMGFYVFVS